MAKVRWGIGGLTILWIIAVGLWAAVALARIARGEMTSATPTARVETRLRAGLPLDASCERAAALVSLGRFAHPASRHGSGPARPYRKL